MWCQSGLFAAVEAQLLVFVKDPSNLPNEMSASGQSALLIFSYWALLFNCSSTVTSFVLSNEFRKIPRRAAQMSGLWKEGVYITSETQLLRIFGASPSSRFVIWYCKSA
jgi:hypothetical protein